MTVPVLVRYFHPEHSGRIGVRLDDVIHDVTDIFPSFDSWLQSTQGRVQQAIDELQTLAQQSSLTFAASEFNNPPDDGKPHLLAPVGAHQDIWAAGVTYIRSRQARQEEAVDGGDVYARVYDAQRPEIFCKARGRQVIGPYGEVGIRRDATWNVPEPELVIVMNPSMELVGFSVGNDMSSRDIEGENPLYLPQAKMYTASCAIGDGILLAPSTEWPDTTIHIEIKRDQQPVFKDSVHTSQIKRKIGELITYLGFSMTFPYGVALLTGTGIVPPNDFTLQAGDVVHISIDGIGTLENTVKVV